MVDLPVGAVSLQFRGFRDTNIPIMTRREKSFDVDNASR
jgi:hypothetical protein